MDGVVGPRVDPYLHWMIGTGLPATCVGRATAYRTVRHGTPGLVALGDVRDQPHAVGRAVGDARASGHPIGRVSMHPAALPDLDVPLGPSVRWEWMLHDGSDVEPPDGPGWLADGWDVVLTRLLAQHSPTAHAHPGDADVHGWAGVVTGGELVAAGAAVTSPAGWPHLRAIVVRPDHRGHGLGTAVTAFLTADARRRTGACSLSLFSDNDGARRLYERLGYRTVRRFGAADVLDPDPAAGPSTSSSTRASRPAP